MRMIFFDTETTGLDPKAHGIHQLAGEIAIAGNVIERFEYRIRPFRKCEIDSAALKISSTTEAELKGYMSEREVLRLLEAKLLGYVCRFRLRKIFLAGWRAPEFDVRFLKALFERNAPRLSFERYFWDNPIDVKSLASLYLLEERPEVESFSLSGVAKFLGIEVNETRLHTAAYDAYLSRKVYEIVTNQRVEV